MSNKIETVSIGDLPIATELDDADELLLRDVSATLPENATARLSIATLRAAMGGGSPDRIESESGDAFVESTDDFAGAGFPGSKMVARSNGASAQVSTAAGLDGNLSFAQVWAGENGITNNGALFRAVYSAETDEKELRAIGAPLEIEEPTAPNHAATKGYVDARPGADAWSEHAATQDVDLDGHKLTGLGAPTEEDDAATKGYVDAVSPTKIERSFSWGRSVAEVTDDGDIELATYRTGEEGDPLRRVRVPRGDTGGPISLMNRNDSGFVSSLSVGTTDPSLTYSVTGGPSGGAFARGGFSFTGGRWYFTEQNGSQIPLGSPGYYTLPGGVSSMKHGIHLAKEAYDTLASMPAPPELEWWEPAWTPVSNVDSVSNVECSYTRVHRASGGSLVTLEGTIEVTPEAAGQCAVQVDLPIARDGSGLLAGTAMAMEVTPPGHVVAVASVDSTTLTLGFDAEGADPYLVGFRISYRAA